MDTNRLLYQANYRPAELAREKARVELADTARQGQATARRLNLGWLELGVLLIKGLLHLARRSPATLKSTPSQLKTSHRS